MSSLFNPDFFKRNPKLGYQFKVEFNISEKYVNDKGVLVENDYDHNSYISRALSTCVDNVTIPNIKIKSNKYFGNVLRNLPEYDLSDMTVKITFTENDDLIVNKLLMFLQSSENSFTTKDKTNYLYTNTYTKTYKITTNKKGEIEDKRNQLVDFLDIMVYEMDIDKKGAHNYKSSLVHVFKNCFIANSDNINMEYLDDPKGVTMNIEFGFMQYYITRPNFLDTGYKFDNSKTYEELETNSESLNEKYTKEKKLSIQLPKPKNLSGTSSGTKNFEVTEDEIKALYKKAQTEALANKGNIDYEDFKRVTLYNAKLMEEAYSKLQNALNKKGYRITLNDFNGTGHETGLGTVSGSHTLSQKIDVTIFDANNKKIDTTNIDEKQADIFMEAAKEAGLITNFETKGTKGSFWGDFALQNAMSIDKKGKVIENIKLDKWVGDYTYYDTSEEAGKKRKSFKKRNNPVTQSTENLIKKYDSEKLQKKEATNNNSKAVTLEAIKKTVTKKQ